jgi:hypothetical protein
MRERANLDVDNLHGSLPLSNPALLTRRFWFYRWQISVSLLRPPVNTRRALQDE